jgi:hypothetical protein
MRAIRAVLRESDLMAYLTMMAVRLVELRPHSSLGYLIPAAFAAGMSRPAPRDATGRDAAVSGASAPRPVAPPPRQGQQQPGLVLSSYAR